MRLIDADALDEARIDYILSGYANSPEDCAEFGMMIIKAPTIEDKPQGEWINDADAEKSICSICNHEYRWIKYDRPYEFKYCPSCGEKMVEPQVEKE